MTNKQYNNRPGSRQPSGTFAGIMRAIFFRKPWIPPLALAAITLLVWGASSAMREPEPRIVRDLVFIRQTVIVRETVIVPQTVLMREVQVTPAPPTHTPYPTATAYATLTPWPRATRYPTATRYATIPLDERRLSAVPPLPAGATYYEVDLQKTVASMVIRVLDLTLVPIAAYPRSAETAEWLDLQAARGAATVAVLTVQTENPSDKVLMVEPAEGTLAIGTQQIQADAHLSDDVWDFVYPGAVQEGRVAFCIDASQLLEGEELEYRLPAISYRFRAVSGTFGFLITLQ